MELNTIYNEDCLCTMQNIHDGSIDIVITSPPYNLCNSTGRGLQFYRRKKNTLCFSKLSKGYAGYNDNMPYDEYIKWQRKCLSEMMRIIKDDGAIFYNHKYRVQNSLLQDWKEIFIGFPVRQIIIWKRKGGINFNPGYFLPTYEVIYMIAKHKFKLKQHANALGDVWEFTQDRKNKHPAPFPIELPQRIIQSTNANIIYDPFIGSGTTALAAIHNNRNYIGSEISPEYCEAAKNRIAEYIKEKKRL